MQRRSACSLAVRRAIVVVAGIALGLSSSPQVAVTRTDTPERCITPNKRMTLYVEELARAADGKPRLGYGLTPTTASIPGPTIELLEGDCVAITVVNDVSSATLAEIRDDPLVGSRDPSMPLGVSLHVHGVKYTQSSDGTTTTDSLVPPDGGTRTYVWYAAPRVVAHGRVVSLGTAGYWWYHDHVVGTEHGTGGLASGLFGALVVRRATDVRPDRTFVVGMGPNATINLRRFPETDCTVPAIELASNSCYVARKGELVEFVVIGFGDEFHTFHLHGHNWADTRTGLLSTAVDDAPLIDNKTVGPADSFGFIVRAGEEVGVGHWMLHCHVQSHSDNGMATFFHVIDAGGAPLPAPPGGMGHHRHG